MNIARTVLLAALASVGSLVAAGPANSALIHDYELNGSLADSLGGPALVANGGTIGASVYTFGKNQGLELAYSALTTTSTYSIQMDFELNTFNGYRKLIDFNSLATDDGFYFYPNNAIGFYNEGEGSTAVTTPTFVSVLLTRDGTTNTLDGYLNGILQFSDADTSGLGVFRGSDSFIHFFEDDAATGNNEATSGSVDCILVYNTALSAAAAANLAACGSAVTPPPPPPPGVPEPGLLSLVALGGATLIASRRRKTR